jgi:hypothetical protein
LAKIATRICQYWEFDEVILRKPPPALDEFVFMGRLHGTGEQDEASGGDSRLRRGAAALLEGRSTREWADPPA